MNSIGGLTEDEQAEFDQLTQEQGDDLYLAPTQPSHSSDHQAHGSSCSTTSSTQQQHGHHAGLRQQRQQHRQGSARCAPSGPGGSVACHHNNHHGTPAAHHGHGRGQGPGRGRGGTGDGHRRGPTPKRAGGRLLRRGGVPSAAAARAEGRAEQDLDVAIKDALGVALREHLCADNSERYRLTPGSYRVPAVPAEARSAAAPIAFVSGGDSSGGGDGGGTSSICASGSGSASAASTGCRDGTDGVGDGCDSSGGDGGGGGNVGGTSCASGSASEASTGCKDDGGDIVGDDCDSDGGGGGNGREPRSASAGGSASVAPAGFTDGSGGVGGRCGGGNGGGGSDTAGNGELEGTRERFLFPRIKNLPKGLQPKAARPAAFEKYTKEFGSRFLERTGFDGRSGDREIENVATLVGKVTAEAHERGGDTGGLGHKHDYAAADRASIPSAVSAPCDMDASRQLGDPAKTYYGIKVEFPFETPMAPQGQMMQRIIAALKSKKHALLESPTGTGKSAAMLCASLAWQ
ncbi:unnamed protein product, partial [Ectocarpus fasciculatus]